jgi:hypothetical protein
MLNTTQFGTLYTAGNLLSDCSDLRFSNSSDLPVSFFTEVCNVTSGANSIVWLTGLTLPAPSNSTTIYMYYGNLGASSTSQTWSGKVYTLFDTLAAGWTDDLSASYTGYFPVLASTYSGTGGATTHGHTFTWAFGGGAGIARDNGGTGTASPVPVISSHTHSQSSNPIAVANNLPPYRDMIFGERTSFVYSMIPANAIIMLNATLPSGWSQYTNLDSKFPRIAVVAGGTAGSATHIHTVSGTTSAASGTTYKWDTGDTYVATSVHTHSFSGDLDSQTLLPAWEGVQFITSTSARAIPAGAVLLFTALPPLGWTQITGNNRFLYGQNSFGGTGGSNTHSHGNFAATTGGPSDASRRIYSGSISAATSGHTHSVTGTADANVDHTPPYLNFILGQREASLPTVTFGAEENVASTYTTVTTSATVTTMSTMTTLTSLTSTITSMTTSTWYTSVTQGPAVNPMNPVAGSLWASTWTGSVNQTQIVYGTVTVQGSGTGTFTIDTVESDTAWVTLNQTKNEACSCYLIFSSVTSGVLTFRVAPGLDVPVNGSVAIYIPHIGIAGHMGNDLAVATTTFLTVYVHSWLPAGPTVIPQPSLTADQAERVGVATTLMLGVGYPVYRWATKRKRST